MAQAQYNAMGLPSSRTDGNGKTTTYANYHISGVPRQVGREGKGGITVTIDESLTSTTVTDDPGEGQPAVVTSRTVNAFDEVAEVETPSGLTYSFSHDPATDTSTVTYGGQTATLTFEKDFLKTMDLPGLPQVSCTRDNNGFPTQATFNGSSVSMTPGVFGTAQSVTPPNRTASTMSDTVFGPVSGSLYGRAWSRSMNSFQEAQREKPPGSTAETVNICNDAGILTSSTDRRGTETTFSLAGDGTLEGMTVDPNGENIVAEVETNDNLQTGQFTLPTSNNSTALLRETTTVYDYFGLPGTTTEASGAQVVTTRDGLARPVSLSAPGLTASADYGADALPDSVTVNGRQTGLVHDVHGRLVEKTDPDGTVTETDFYDSGLLKERRVRDSQGGLLSKETFAHVHNGDGTTTLTHSIDGTDHTTTLTFSSGDLTAVTNADGVTRTIGYAGDGQVSSDTGASFGHDSEGRINQITVNGVTFTLTYNNEGRVETVERGQGNVIYTMAYDNAGRLESITDTTSPLDGPQVIDTTPDAAGYAWERELPFGAVLTQAINDVNSVVSSSLDISACDFEETVTIGNLDHVLPSTITRPGVATTNIGYTPAKEVLSATHNGGSAGVTLTRDGNNGRVTSRNLHHLGVQDTFGYDGKGQLTSETRSDGSHTATYTYDPDGVRNSMTLNGRTTTYVRSNGGLITSIENAQLCGQLRAPLEGPVYKVGGGGYASIPEAIKAIFRVRGPETFTQPAVILIDPDTTIFDTTITNEVGVLSDNFNDGEAQDWDQTVTSGTGTVNLEQATIRLGGAGYAPKFHAASGDTAYLHKSLNAQATVFEASFQLYLDSADLDAAGDQAVLVRVLDGTQSVIEVRLVFNAGLKLAAYVYADEGQGPGWVSAGETAVPLQQWWEVAVVAKADTMGGPDAANGRFRWWVQGSLVGEALTGLEMPQDTYYNAMDFGLASATGCTVDAIADNFGVGALKPTASSPIIVRSPADSTVTITNDLTVSGLDYVRLQGLHVGQASLSFSSVSGPALASCVVKAPVTFTGCTDAKVIGNTFDTRTTGETVTFTNCTGARVRNNVFWNDGVEPGLTWTGTAPDSDVNLYYPADISPAETNSVSVDPGLDSTDYTVLGSTSAVYSNKGTAQSDYDVDAQGWYRHLSFPCRGAFEYQVIENSGVDASGRVTGRTIAGRPHTLSYDAQGRLTSATSLDGISVTYEYDHLGRRVKVTVGNCVTRMVYDGTDVVADIVDEDGDGIVDRRRLYWILPQIDQRVGFVDIVGGTASAYYYVTDQVGSVLQVLDSSGTVVNQYNYDAFGNLLLDGTFEGVENRYRFQGREWDENLQAYYFRYRLYFPETGTFSGPDMEVGVAATAACSYLAFDNAPMAFTDPLGLWTESGVIRAFTEKYGSNANAMAALIAILSRYSLAEGGFYFDDYGVNHESRQIAIAGTAWLGSERSDENAAGQLYQILADEFYGITDLPETWGHWGKRKAGATGKVLGGGLSVLGGKALLVTPEPTMLTKVGGVGAIAFGANTFIDGTTQWCRRGGGINLVGEAAGAYGNWVNGAEGEATARYWVGWGEFGFTTVGLGGHSKLLSKISLRQLPAATRQALTQAVAAFRSSASQASRLEFAIEQVEGFTLVGSKGLQGRTFLRMVGQVDSEGKVLNAWKLMKALEAEARASGAAKLRILGRGITEERFLNPSLWARLGYTVEAMDSLTFEVVKKL